MLLVGTDDGLFDLSGPTPRQSLAGHTVTALTRGAGVWWALVDGHSLVRGEPAGGWREAGDLAPLGVTGHCLLAEADDVWIGTSGAHVVHREATADDAELTTLESFDGVEGRERWYTPWGAPPDVRSLAGAGDRLYVNVHVGGVWRWSPGGPGWDLVVDVEADTHQVWTGDEREVVVAAAVGVGYSRDGGTTWEWTTEGLHGSYCRAVTSAGNAVVVSASTGPFTSEAALYRATGSGRAFERCTGGLPEWFDSNIDTHCLAGRGDDVAMGTAEGTVHRSPDAGTSWSLVADQLPAVRCLSF